MNRSKSLLFIAAVIALTGTGCQKKIKTTSFIVGPTLSAAPGISEHGVLQWVTLNGPEFIVHFDSPSPCVNGQNDIPGSKDAPAQCTIAPGNDGALKFEILAKGATPNVRAVVATASIGKYPIYADIDYCHGCKGVVPIKNPIEPMHPGLPAITISNPPTIHIDCDGPDSSATADLDPLQVYAGQQILWEQVGPAKTVHWQTDLPDGLCLKYKTFGTTAADLPQICTVSGGATTGENAYTLTYLDTKTNKPCKGTAKLVVVAAPAGP